MDDEPGQGPSPQREPSAGPTGEGAPSEEELRRRLEQELRKLRIQDVLLQSVVSLINLTSRRIAKEDERDLDQARVGIDAVRALVDFLDPDSADQVRNALAELQVAYARAAGAGGEPGEPSGEEPSVAQPEKGPQGEQGGERKPPPGLWTPPGSA
jgi:hypothetical protein